MGWCSGTEIFDVVVKAILDEKADKKQAITQLIDTLEGMGWYCQYESDYIQHPLIKEIFLERSDSYNTWEEFYSDNPG